MSMQQIILNKIEDEEFLRNSLLLIGTSFNKTEEQLKEELNELEVKLESLRKIILG